MAGRGGLGQEFYEKEERQVAMRELPGRAPGALARKLANGTSPKGAGRDAITLY